MKPWIFPFLSRFCFFSFHTVSRVFEMMFHVWGGPKASNPILIAFKSHVTNVNPYVWLKSKMNKSRTPKKLMMKTMKTHDFLWSNMVKPCFFGWLGSGSKTSAGAESLAAPVATAAVGGWVSRQQAVHASVRRQVQHWWGMKEYYLQWLIEYSYGSYGLWNEKNVWFQVYIYISYTVCIYLWSISDFP